MKQSVKAACIQMGCEPWNIRRNLEKAHNFIKMAKESGAEIVILPELFNIGYDLGTFNYTASDYSITIGELSKMARSYEVQIVAGIAELNGEQVFNSASVFNRNGELICNYRKNNLFPLSQEKRIFTKGDGIACFNMNGITFGLLICFDIRFPEIARQYIEKGCSAIIVVSAFPFPRLEHWQILLRARAIENQAYIIASNRVGREGGNFFLGNSCIIDPWGTVKALCNETEENIIVYDIKQDTVSAIRKSMPCLSL